MKKTGTRANNSKKIDSGKTVESSKKAVPIKIRSTAKPFYIVCIGASAGGLNAVGELVSQFPLQINAAIFVVLHLSKSAIGDILVTRLEKATSLSCEVAKNGVIIQPGHIYIAPPDVHLLVGDGKIVIGHGPPENRFRPSIDVLFRSAAAHYGEKTIGIILTGFLNDGTVGMWSIKQSGGHTIVQDPNEAEYPDMPLSVLETMETDYCTQLKKISDVVLKIIEDAESKGISPPPAIVAESKLSEKSATTIEQVAELGEKTLFACPDCGGGLWQISNDRVKHYRCHIGHSYSETDMIVRQSQAIEQTLWVALRMMEERKILLKKTATENENKGLTSLSVSMREQARQLENHVEKLKELLFAVVKD
jgi:two-component system chemotaxis response regulator CheB